MTARTWIDQGLAQGARGLEQVLRFLMDVYHVPLRAWVSTRSWSREHDAEDLVMSFFAHRLTQGDYLAKWSESGLRLRVWLARGLRYHAWELARASRRIPPKGPELEEVTVEDDTIAALDREFARSIVDVAMQRTERWCTDDQLDEHFAIFREHFNEERSFVAIAQARQLDAERVRTMCRVVARRFRASLREFIARDGATEPEIDRQIHELLESIS
ncbi:MAG: hypothetical protein H6834_09490 [Planctomycetes bacterium]|nr:hypothetical protein [Planctomycetota bacterium]